MWYQYNLPERFYHISVRVLHHCKRASEGRGLEGGEAHIRAEFVRHGSVNDGILKATEVCVLDDKR